MSNYNGWTNYATWRVNLEIFDGFDLHDAGLHRLDVYDLSQTLKDYADEILTDNGASGLALDYARAFMSEVNWREIAEAVIESNTDEDTDTDENTDEELA